MDPPQKKLRTSDRCQLTGSAGTDLATVTLLRKKKLKKSKAGASKRSQDPKTGTVDVYRPTRANVDEWRDDIGPKFTTVLDKFLIPTRLYEDVERCLNAVYPYLIEGDEYTVEELMWGGLWPGPGPDDPGVVYCLKHLARQANALMLEVTWDTFVVVGDEQPEE